MAGLLSLRLRMSVKRPNQAAAETMRLLVVRLRQGAARADAQLAVRRVVFEIPPQQFGATKHHHVERNDAKEERNAHL